MAGLASGWLSVWVVVGVALAQGDEPVTVRPVSSTEDRAAAAGWGTGTWRDQHDACVAIARQGGIDVVLLGDSITQSLGGPGRTVSAGGARARERWLDREFRVANFGISGDRTQHVLWRLANGTLDGLDPRAVVLAIGTNNLSAGDAPADVAAGIAAIVQAVHQRLPHAAIVVQGVLPRGATGDDAMRRATVAVNALLAAAAPLPNVTFVDFTARFVDDDGRLRDGVLAGDALHLTVAGYEVWCEHLVAALAKAIAALPPHVVFVAGDEEYRSEESLPFLAEVLASMLYARTSICLPRDAKGAVDPCTLDHIDGLQALDSADLMVMFTRFRALPEPELRRVDQHVARGLPVVGFRTSTHAFRYPAGELAARYNDAWPREVFGQRWLAHHGHFDDGRSPLTDVAPVAVASAHPVLRGVGAFAAFSWLYHVDGVDTPLPADCVPLLQGTARRSGLDERRFPRTQPVAWVRERLRGEGQPPQRVFFTTLGHGYDFRDANLRRLCVQGMLWALRRESAIPADGLQLPELPWNPSNSGVGGHRR